ncbi:hypothetical protein EAF04_006469 [Stromatinia cepivora]|nr:hypothetical protein EAF04_006469 [Stromatinia cepivora]
MASFVGQILKGKKGSYQLLEALKSSTVFKAQPLPINSRHTTFAVAKTALGDQKIALNREHKRYQNPVVASSQHIRALLDVVGERDHNLEPDEELDEIEPPSLILEWMENDLRSVSSAPFRADSPLPKVIAKSVLSALVLMKDLHSIHTDVNPNNIFLSGINGPTPVVKLGDLGNMITEGFKAIRV